LGMCSMVVLRGLWGTFIFVFSVLSLSMVRVGSVWSDVAFLFLLLLFSLQAIFYVFTAGLIKYVLRIGIVVTGFTVIILMLVLSRGSPEKKRESRFGRGVGT